MWRSEPCKDLGEEHSKRRNSKRRDPEEKQEVGQCGVCEVESNRNWGKGLELMLDYLGLIGYFKTMGSLWKIFKKEIKYFALYGNK